MNKTELIASMAEKAELSKKDSEKALKAFTDTIKETLTEGGEVQLIGFGAFKVKNRAERSGRNPKTGEEITIPACKAPVFKPGKELKEIVNQ